MIQIPPQILEEFNANGINVMPLHKCKYCNDGRNREFHSPPFGNNNMKFRSPARFFQRGNRQALNENQAAYRAQQRLPTKGGYVQQQQIQQQREMPNYGSKGGGNDYQGGFRPMTYQGKGGRQQQLPLRGNDSNKKIVVVVLHLNKNDKVMAGGASPGGYGGIVGRSGFGGVKGGSNPYARIDQQQIGQLKYASPPSSSASTDSVYFDTSLFTPDNFFTMRDLAHSALFGGAPGISNLNNNNNGNTNNIINSSNNNNAQSLPIVSTTSRPIERSPSVPTNSHNSSPFNADTEMITQEKEDEASYRAATDPLPNIPNSPSSALSASSSSVHHPFSS
jgi:hypothetical protein